MSLTSSELKTEPARQHGTANAREGIRAGTPAFRRTCIALFLAGCSTFWMVWWVQPLLPMFSHDFGVSAAQSSALLSVTTAGLALALLPAGVLSNRYGRKQMMAVALGFAALLTVAITFIHDFSVLVVIRVLLGMVLAGVPAVAMAYLAEEIEPASLGRAMGIYLTGNLIGGTGGRIVTAMLSDALGWRMAVAAIGVTGLLASILFWRKLPASRHFTSRPMPLDTVGRRSFVLQIKALLQDEGLPWLFGTGFIAMGCFTSLYNFLPYRLAAEPFHLHPGWIGAVFSIYLVGVIGTNWAGRLGDRIGLHNMLWGTMGGMLGGLPLTLSESLPVVIAGIALFTFCFFGSHAVASSWIGNRAGKNSKALASALYLCCYYFGPSVIGPLSGMLWTTHQWRGVIAVLGPWLLVGLLIALRLRRLAPTRGRAG